MTNHIHRRMAMEMGMVRKENIPDHVESAIKRIPVEPTPTHVRPATSRELYYHESDIHGYGGTIGRKYRPQPQQKMKSHKERY